MLDTTLYLNTKTSIHLLLQVCEVSVFSLRLSIPHPRPSTLQALEPGTWSSPNLYDAQHISAVRFGSHKGTQSGQPAISIDEEFHFKTWVFVVGSLSENIYFPKTKHPHRLPQLINTNLAHNSPCLTAKLVDACLWYSFLHRCRERRTCGAPLLILRSRHSFFPASTTAFSTLEQFLHSTS